MRERAILRALALGVMFFAAPLLIAGDLCAQTIRGHGTSRRSSHSHHSHGHGGYIYGGAGFYASYYYLPQFYPYGYYYPPYPAYYGPSYLPDVAYLDTDVRPEEAEVRVDGDYVGIADDFDGFPRYLSVTPGRHSITLSAEGRKTVTRTVRVPRGSVLQMNFTMPRGSGEEPASAEGQAEEIVVPEQGRQGEAPVPDDDATDPVEPSAEPGFVRLTIAPPDASIYLDGRLIGSASRLSRLHGELRLEAGRHRIEAVRPGYQALSRELDIEPGDHLTLNLDLERAAPGGNAPR